MRNPVMTMVQHLMWSRTGVVWATWRLTGLPYGYRPDEAKAEIRSMHEMLLRTHHGEALLLGLRSAIDPTTVVEAMVDGVDLDSCPAWAAECEATLDQMESYNLAERTFWLSVPLTNEGVKARFLEPLRAVTGDLQDRLAIPRGGITPEVLALRLAQARLIEQSLPAAFQPRPATVAEQVWVQLHAQQRGMAGEVSLPAQPGDLIGELLTAKRGSCIPEVIVDEGGRSDVEAGQRRSLDPRKRRFIKVDSDLEQASYQALVALTDVPGDGMVFPGSEFLGRVDDVGPYVDWAVRLKISSRDAVLARNRRAVRNLNDQYDQRDTEASTGTNELDLAAASLAEYQSALAADELEVEVEATVIFAIAADTAQAVEDAATEFTKHYAGAHYKVPRPIGFQAALWWAMLPGVPASRIVRDLSQIATSHGFAAACPLITTGLGDLRGSLLGINVSTAVPSPVLLDMAGATQIKDMSGSIGVTGELGSGKSVLEKKCATDVSDMGGKWLAVDGSKAREWAQMARALPSYAIADIMEPQYSLDPLRIFGPVAGARAAQSFFTPLFNVETTSDRGVLLSAVLEPKYLQANNITSSGQLVEHLTTSCSITGAAELGHLMEVFSGKDLGRVVFDPGLPILPLDRAAIVFGTNGLELPRPEELTSEHLFRQLKMEKSLGRAIYALIAAIGRQEAFADPGQLVLFVVDECHHITASAEGEAELIPFIRDGRKHGAAAVLGSHDAETDFGSATLNGLIPVKILMRHRDPELARRGLKWLGLDQADSALVDLITKETSPIGVHGIPLERRGEGLMRDAQGRVGRIKVLMPARADRAAAISTTPTARPVRVRS